MIQSVAFYCLFFVLSFFLFMLLGFFGEAALALVVVLVGFYVCARAKD